eukprot:3800100-Rhodomonas_salina.1
MMQAPVGWPQCADSSVASRHSAVTAFQGFWERGVTARVKGAFCRRVVGSGTTRVPGGWGYQHSPESEQLGVQRKHVHDGRMGGGPPPPICPSWTCLHPAARRLGALLAAHSRKPTYPA